jgi:hypothetical protein
MGDHTGHRRHMRVTDMELLIFYPDGHSKTRHFDGPPSLALQQAVGGDVDVVPGFSSISQAGVVHRCVAYCGKDGKGGGRPINTWATALWHLALRRHGYERGLRRPNGKVADWLVGNVAVVMEAAVASLTSSSRPPVVAGCNPDPRIPWNTPRRSSGKNTKTVTRPAGSG